MSRIRSIVSRLSGFARRHEVVLWSLHSAWALAVGIGVMWLGARNYAYLRFALFYIAVLWISGLILPTLVDRPGGNARWRWWGRLVLNYFNKNFYQQLLFFLLPVYYASASRWSPNLLFVAFLAVSALLSTLDVVYDRHLSTRRGLLGVFFAFNLFACINVMLPAIWSISNRVALPVSAVLGMLAYATIRYRWRDFGNHHVRMSMGLSAIVLVMLVALGRPLIPPAPLRLVNAAFGTSIDRRAFRVAGELDRLPAGWSGRVYGVTAVYAPLGLRDRMEHRWYQDGQLLRVSPSYEMTGGRTQGFRLWTSVIVKDVQPGTKLRLDVRTEAGQLVGRAEVRAGM